MSNDNYSKTIKPSPTRLHRLAHRTIASGLLILITCSLASGCQTAAFSRLKMPKLPTMKMPKLSSPKKLAFWKKDKLDMPPPPARHFAPTGTDGVTSPAQQYANNSSSGADDMDAVKRRIDNVLDDQKQSYGSASESLAQTAKAAVDAIPKKSLAKSNFKSDLPTGGSDFSSAPLSAGKTSGLSEAQNQFNAALANTKKAFDAPSKFESAAKPAATAWKEGGFKLPGLNGDVATNAQSQFKNAMNNVNSTKYDAAGNLMGAKNAVKDIASKNPFKSGFRKPDAPAFPNNNALAKVNQSLYDAQGRLVSGSKNLAKNLPTAIPNVMGQAKSNFGSAIGKVGEVAKSTQATTNSMVSNGADKLRQSFNSAKQALPKTNPNNSMASNSMASNPVANNSFSNGFKPAPANNLPVQPAPSRNMAPFNAAAPSNNAMSTAMNSGQSFQPAQTPIQPPPPKSTIASSNAFRSANTGFYGNGGQAQGVPSLQPATGATPANILRNGFPTAQAGGNNFGAPQFSSASSLPISQTNRAATPVSHVAEIDIPANVLSGSSSYAPGSVHALR